MQRSTTFKNVAKNVSANTFSTTTQLKVPVYNRPPKKAPIGTIAFMKNTGSLYCSTNQGWMSIGSDVISNVETISSNITIANGSFDGQTRKIVNNGPNAINNIGSLSSTVLDIVQDTIDPNTVYVGGYFEIADNVLANGFAKYNILTNTWSSMNINNYIDVQTIFVNDNGDVYIGGWFDNINGDSNIRNIAKWDGNQWSGLGIPNSDVLKIFIHNDYLYICGWFSRINNDPNFIGVARYNLNTQEWQTLAKGINNNVIDIVYFDNKIIVATSSNNTVCTNNDDSTVEIGRLGFWDILTQEWQQINNEPITTSSGIQTLSIINDELYIGGGFSVFQNTIVNHIVKYNFNDNLFTPLANGVDDTVYSITSFDGNIYVGGRFDNAGSIYTPKIAIWNGNNWLPFGSGANDRIEVITVVDNKLFIGGRFEKFLDLDMEKITFIIPNNIINVTGNFMLNNTVIDSFNLFTRGQILDLIWLNPYWYIQ